MLLFSALPYRAYLWVEEEVGSDGELDPQQGACDWLNASGQLYAGELVDQSVKSLAHAGKLYQLAQVGRLKVVVPVPRDFLPLQLADDHFRQQRELAQRALAQPTPGEGPNVKAENTALHF